MSIHAYKYNGHLYRTHEFGRIINSNDDYICVDITKAHIICEKNNKFYPSDIKSKSLWYFFKKEWFNLIVGSKNKHIFLYFHIASPYIYEDGTIKYIDFDLDYRVNNVDSPTLKELDIHEYIENAKQYNYPPELKSRIEETSRLVKKLFKDNYFDQFIDRKFLSE